MKRQSGIDLIRVMCLFCVVGAHQFLHNGFYDEPQIGLLMWSVDIWRWLFVCCISIFLMMSGYLRCNKTDMLDCYRGLIPVLLGYILSCAVIFPVQYLMGDHASLATWIKRLIHFGNYGWYVEMYIGLVLFSPVINLGMKHMSDKTLGIFALIMIFVTSLHEMTTVNLVPDYWRELYPVTYYVMGAAIRRLQPRVKAWQGLGAALVIAMGLAAASILTTDEGFSSGFAQGHGGFWPLLVGVSLFLGLYRLQIGKVTGKILGWLAGGVFEGYLISIIFDPWTYSLVKQWHTPDKYWLAFLVVTIPTFICTLLLGKLVSILADAVAKQIPGYMKKSKV